MKPNKIKGKEQMLKEFEERFEIDDVWENMTDGTPITRWADGKSKIKQFISKAIDKAYKEGLSKGFDDGRDFGANTTKGDGGYIQTRIKNIFFNYKTKNK